MIVADDLHHIVGQFAYDIAEDFGIEYDASLFVDFSRKCFFDACFEIVAAKGEFIFCCNK